MMPPRQFVSRTHQTHLHETRSSVGEYGAHEMTVEQHEMLLGTLAGV